LHDGLTNVSDTSAFARTRHSALGDAVARIGSFAGSPFSRALDTTGILSGSADRHSQDSLAGEVVRATRVLGADDWSGAGANPRRREGPWVWMRAVVRAFLRMFIRLSGFLKLRNLSFLGSGQRKNRLKAHS
jgi:hypothetical protein